MFTKPYDFPPTLGHILERAMPPLPTDVAPLVDINLFVHDGARTVAAAIDSVLAQTWTRWRLTLIDDGSTDGTAELLADYAARHPAIRLKHNRCNTGAVGAFQRGFWFGDADYVMPKSADDLIAPEFVAEIMSVLLEHPDCAMAHAAGLSFVGAGAVRFVYPPEHCLQAVADDPVERAAHVMARYTSSPSFWGIYRRAAVDLLAPIAYRAGWDHVLLAELALYGQIRHVPQALLWRRGGGRPIRDLARAATQDSTRGLTLDDPIADPMWRAPCITTAYAHIENFALARLPAMQRDRLMAACIDIFDRRWHALMWRELDGLRDHVGSAIAAARHLAPPLRELAHLQLVRLLGAAAIMLPEAELGRERDLVAGLVGECMHA